MLKELTKNEWLSLLNIPENRVPTVLVLRGTRKRREKQRFKSGPVRVILL